MAPRKRKPARNAIALDSAALRDWPLPDPNEARDKDERGRVLIVGGCAEMPGAIMLASHAAMRAGAGKLCIATVASVLGHVAQASPEARVLALDETSKGGLRTNRLRGLPDEADAVLVGPGVMDESATIALTHALLRRYPRAAFILDTLAMSAVTDPARSAHRMRAVITPHLGEMAHLTGSEKHQIERRMQAIAREASQRWQCVVALKSSTTLIASPAGRVWRHDDGHAGLGVSGSGDVLAGAIAGFASRGATLEQATAWGVTVHGHCGRLLAARIGPVGYLAREIAQEIPSALRAIASGDNTSA